MRRMPFGHVLRGQRVLTCAASTRCLGLKLATYRAVTIK